MCDAETEDGQSNEMEVSMSCTEADRSSSDGPAELHIYNLPSFIGVKQMKLCLRRFSVVPRKVITLKNHAYVTFAKKSDADSAAAKLKDAHYKGRKLKVKRSCFADARPAKRIIENSSPKDINDVVTPLHAYPYEKQLKLKYDKCLETLIVNSVQIAKVCDEALPRCRYYGTLSSIVASPVITGYRNKCEFTVGYKDGKPEVGFRLSRFKFGCEVEPPDRCLHVSDMMKAFVRAFKAYVSASPWPPFSNEQRNGVWRQIAVRSFLSDFMVIVTINPKELSPSDIDTIKTSLVANLFRNQAPDYRLTSLFLQEIENASSDAQAYELLDGCPYAYETIDKFRFRISPTSFFQTNSAGCAVLYKTVLDICCSYVPDHNSALLLDICCGTGTIGIFLAEHFGRVVGIERTEAAVEDAIANAKGNRLSNCRFVCGDAEQAFEDVKRGNDLHLLGSQTCVGVLDPPRAGLSAKLIASIRSFENMQYLVYISCDLRAALHNLMALCRRCSKRYCGKPFLLKKTVPVDMFPQTTHCETVMLFEHQR
ncbi:unnamed protein product [Soboliphyme baturini]|uniref:tRNA (uracil(54)-C(5))-methyltransferase n=1 Tax=Soboliphyme baturini TaxID=241478 RepID=A0A183J687_9BILA|nr:unnamed protein product [Soboliphyme baturini]